MIVLAHLTRERDAGATTIGWLIGIVQDDGPRDTVAEVIEPAQLVRDGPILLQKLAAMDLAAGPFVEPRFEALALTHFTQL
ncbi:hypothetical protein [Bradyrhizobium sp. 187]|uniref:hypothetical protein n=1 Tax=Bradyrhizobium sp. 187 TaxID=2782655 RepID=UPI001FFE55C1|nr:hypothetical protein [Bradyrhizobium sp. 187]UPJ71067.1 hypothetical protein IVB19_25885 [Bradyrhizobium sp. 187]